VQEVDPSAIQESNQGILGIKKNWSVDFN